jgi:hypothetical protein
MTKIPPKYKKQLNKDQPRFEKNIEVLLKKGKGKQIKEEVFHKVKVGDRRRQIELQKLDNEQDLENAINEIVVIINLLNI